MAELEHNPFETPRPRGIRSMQAALRVVVAVQCFGAAAAHLHHKQGDVLCDLIGKMRSLPADQISSLSDIVSYVLIAAGVFTLLRPVNIALLALTVYQAGTAIAPFLNQGTAVEAIPLLLQATRIIVPIALLLVDFWPPSMKASLGMCLTSVLLLKLATAATFIAHGILGIQQARTGGPELDLYLQALRNAFRGPFNMDDARRILESVAVIEIGLAISLLSGRGKVTMFACAVVGLLTALAYTIADAPGGYSQTLIRISLSGAPLAAMLFFLTAVKEQPPIYLAELRRSASSAEPAPAPPSMGRKR